MTPRTIPIELPEILRRISVFVTLNDAVSCAQVCKRWSENFVWVIWHSIDFAIHKELHKMSSKVLTRYGHHIRVAKNVTEYDHLQVLSVSNATKLREVTVTMMGTPEFHLYYGNIMRKNNTSVQRIEVKQASTGAVQFFAVDTLFPRMEAVATSKLSYLRIEGLTLSRNGFSSLLQHCPLLRTLNIRDTTLLSWPVYDKSGADCHQHFGLQELTATIKQVFRPDRFEFAPSLLVHFPRMKSWTAWNADTVALDVPIDEIRDQVTKFCPVLKNLWTSTNASMTMDLLVQAFDNLTGICIYNKFLSIEVVMAFLHHQETLTHVHTYKNQTHFYSSNTIPKAESNQLESAGWVIQSIPRRCTHLTSFKLPLFEMRMDDIEKAKWNCLNLSHLFIRIQGLNTEEKIDRAIQLWMDARAARKKEQANRTEPPTSADLIETAIPESDTSIEARVARHLAKFEKLREVWLGWKVRKSWSENFVWAIWHTIDFAAHKELHRTSSKVLAKYGHHIRVVKNIKEYDHIQVLIASHATKLREITISMMATQEFYACYGSVLRRNNTTVQRIEMTQPSATTVPFFTVDPLFPHTDMGMTSRLLYLKMDGLTMPRDGFAFLLQACPSLDTLHIRDTTLLSWPGDDNTSYYQHLGLRELISPIKCLSIEVVMSVLHHRETLTKVGTFTSYGELDSDNVPDIERNQPKTPGWIIQSLPRHCAKLDQLSLPLYEMNMDDIEDVKWTCHNLKKLDIRIQGLNTKEKIDRAIQLWIAARNARKHTDEAQTSSSGADTTIPESDNSIEARVARHLLKFKKLRSVIYGAIDGKGAVLV
ncbi:hypothetical protein BGX31_010927 [Mortierella sp. GBA43]|nr:hypothetical protein BGX31_010927 [Mortierella sp. GBA43]